MVSIDGSGYHPDVLSPAVILSDFQSLYDSFKPLLSQLLPFLISSSLPPDHLLLVFLSHIFFTSNTLVQFVPLVVAAKFQEVGF